MGLWHTHGSPNLGQKTRPNNKSKKVKLATIVEGDPKAPFSIATTPRCRGGCYSFPVLLYFTLDPYLIMLSVKQGGIKYHFLSLWYGSTWDWTQVSRAIGEKRICKIVDFAVPADHRIKLKECEKKDKYLDLARELKKLWNMQVTIIPVIIGAFGTVTKGSLKWLEDLAFGGRVETIQTTALLRTARILRRVLETWGDLLSLKLQERPSANADVKNSNE